MADDFIGEPVIPSYQAQTYADIHAHRLSRQEAKEVVRERIAILRRHLRCYEPVDIGDITRMAARLRNRCHQLRDLHQAADW